MTLPPSSTADGDATPRRAPMTALALTGVLIGLKAFALGASGALSALASLVESLLAFTALATAIFATRWQALLPPMTPAVASAISVLVQSGMAMAAALFVGILALFGLFDPRPVGGGLWGVGAIVAALAVAALLVWNQMRPALSGRDRLSGLLVDLVPGFIVLIGIVGGALLKAPGLDAASALVVAVWLFWGAFTPIRRSARMLGQS
jgi:ferrous-iron efflux pump FieF